MTITENTTVAELATAIPPSVRVFQRRGIDFCCGGKRRIGVVCEELGLSFAEVSAEIEAAATAPAPDERDWTTAPLDALVDHIVATYHDPLREELPRLETMAARVAQVHGANAPFLKRVDEIVVAFGEDLRSHMREEETMLFPAIRNAARAGNADQTIAGRVSELASDHDRAGELLAELRRITSGYTAPDWACQTFRSLYFGLKVLETSMHVHVHLENNVLFPRALDAESRA